MGVKSNHVQIEQRKLNWKAESKVGSLEKVRRAEALEITLYLPNYRICIWISSSYICANQNNLWPIRQPIALGEATLKLKTENWNGKLSQRYFLGTTYYIDIQSEKNVHYAAGMESRVLLPLNLPSFFLKSLKNIAYFLMECFYRWDRRRTLVTSLKAETCLYTTKRLSAQTIIFS